MYIISDTAVGFTAKLSSATYSNASSIIRGSSIQRLQRDSVHVSKPRALSVPRIDADEY